MIKLLCPHCMKTVSVPDDAAGADTPCPECGQSFPVPARYTPVVAPEPPTRGLTPPGSPPAVVPPEPVPMSPTPPDRPPPPPGLTPPAYPSPGTQLEPPLPPEPPVPDVPAGYTFSRGITLSPRAMAWVPAVGLTLILLLTFFTWVGVYPGGHPVYGQGAWRAVSGRPARSSFQLEPLLVGDLPAPPVPDRVRTDAGLMVPYLLALLLAVVVAWAERMVASLDRYRLPPWLRWVTGVWPYRIPLLAGLATIALILLSVQCVRGFGLERAMKQAVSDKFAPERAAAADSPSKQDTVAFHEDQELGKYGLERTTWLHLVIVLHVLVVLAMIVRAWLDRRGHRPPPRLVLQY